MRDRPFAIDAVTAESAAQLIVDAAIRHSLEGHANHGARFVVAVAHSRVEAEREIGRMRKLRCRSESAMRAVEAPFQFGKRRRNGFCCLAFQP